MSAMLHRAYEAAVRCSSGPTPGAQALMSWYLGAYAPHGAANLGIYLCKILGSGWSVHAEGRACDLGTTPYGNPAGTGRWPDWGWDLAETLRIYSGPLGVQALIFDRRIWSGAFPDAGWRPYSGSNPHTGHIHAELSRAAAASLTAAQVEATIGDKPAPPPASPPSSRWIDEVLRSLPTVRRGDRGVAVARSMGLLAAAGHPPANSVRNGRWDGIAGPGWESACRAWQAAASVRNSVLASGRGDGVFGRYSWTHAVTGSSPAGGAALPATVRRGDRGVVVARSMGLLAAAGHPPANSLLSSGRYDGVAGPGWESACRAWQAAASVRNSVLASGRGDGVFGRYSWTHALTGRS